ncbi:uncharacterized protein V1516DRAFT_611110, partial [Lipomyces oligophaga]|uniref:uncharacterized protein n=1 Tax=Lipomyces oligophaga TaxID=45792 RepID=UPI0034CF8A2C
NKHVFYVTFKSPFISLLKRAKDKVEKLHSSKNFSKSSTPSIQFVGLAKAIPKTLSLGLRFKAMGYDMKVYCDTVAIVEEVEAEDKSWIERKRNVSRITVKITV